MNLAQDPARLIVLLLSVVMLGIVGYGFASGNLDAFLAALFSEAWNQVTLADLYISFWLMSVVMFVFSPRKWTAVPWIVAINIIGARFSGFGSCLICPDCAKPWHDAKPVRPRRPRPETARRPIAAHAFR